MKYSEYDEIDSVINEFFKLKQKITTINNEHAIQSILILQRHTVILFSI